MGRDKADELRDAISEATQEEAMRTGHRTSLRTDPGPVRTFYGSFAGNLIVIMDALYIILHLIMNATATRIGTTKAITAALPVSAENDLGDKAEPQVNSEDQADLTVGVGQGQLNLSLETAPARGRLTTRMSARTASHRARSGLEYCHHRMTDQEEAAVATERSGSSLALTSRRPHRPKCACTPVAPRRPNPAT